MDLLDLIFAPGIVIGCLVGIALAAGLHWLFPDKDLRTLQALIIVATTVIGIAADYLASSGPKKKG